MRSGTFSNEEAARLGYTDWVEISYTDLNDTAGLTKTLAIFPRSGNAPAGFTIRKAASYVNTAFVGCATLGCEIGDGGAVARNLASSDMKAAAGTFKVAVPSTSPSVFNSADTIDALFTATTNNLTLLSAGKVTILLDLADLNKALGN